MSRLDQLPPDQRAALSLLLQKGKQYAEVAALLGIAEQAVHDRAQAALAVLAPAQARGLSAADRQLLGDYLLGQQPAVAERLRSRTLLSSSAAANAWARAVAGELAGLKPDGLPAIPPSGAESAPPPASLATGAPEGSQRAPSSRLGGALLLAALAAAVVVAVLLISGAGGGSKRTASTATGAGKAAGTAKVEGRFSLKAPGGGSSSVGAVEVLAEGGKRAFYIQAEHLPASKGFFYAIWLYNSSGGALPLSKAPAVGANHKLAGAAPLPTNASQYHEMLLTRETSSRPTRPGHIVLRGPFSAGA